MDVVGTLNRLRTSVSGCHAAALVDLDTNMVLTKDAEWQIGQETWEDLTARAIDLLVGPRAKTLVAAISDEPADTMQSALLQHDDEIVVLLRSKVEPPLGLIFACEKNSDIRSLIQSSMTELDAIAAVS